MRIILITILIYKKRFPAPEWQNEVKNQWRLRQSGKVKCKHEVFVTQRVIHRLSTSLSHTQAAKAVKCPIHHCGYPAHHPSIVARFPALVKSFLQNKTRFRGFCIRTLVLLIFWWFEHLLFLDCLRNLCLISLQLLILPLMLLLFCGLFSLFRFSCCSP